MKNTCLVFLALLCACAPSRFVKPLKEGEQALSFNVGGPLIGFSNTTIPMPLSSFTYGYGLKDSRTVFGSVHTTAMIYGVFQGEIGILQNIRQQQGYIPGLSTSIVTNLATDKWEGKFRFWPQVDLNAYWTYGKHQNIAYIGLSNWFEIRSKRSLEQKQEHHWLLNPQLGTRLMRTKWEYGVEVKWLMPNLNNQPNAVEYKGINGKGAIGLYLSVGYTF